MPDPFLDDIDRIFACAGSVEPPEDLLDRVLLETRSEGAHSVQPTAWGVPALYAGAYLLALAGLLVLAYELGLAIAHSGTTVLIGTLVNDAELLREAPSAYAVALVASIPWLHLFGVVLDLAIIAIMTRLVLRGAPDATSGEGVRA